MPSHMIVTPQIVVKVECEADAVKGLIESRVFEASGVWFHGNRNMGPRTVELNPTYVVAVIFDA